MGLLGKVAAVKAVKGHAAAKAAPPVAAATATQQAEAPAEEKK
jgi:hypothetical protein